MPTGTIPQSTALAEANPFSLSELMSRDPQGYTRQDRTQIIGLLRERRKGWEKAQVEGKPVRQPKVAKTNATAEDLGL